MNQVLRLGYAWDRVTLGQFLPVAFRGDLDYTLSFDVFGSTDIDGAAGTEANTDYWVTFNDPGGAGEVLRVNLTTPAVSTTVNVSLPACAAKVADGNRMLIRFNKGDTRPGGTEQFVWIDNVTLTAVAAAPEVCIGQQPADQTLVLGSSQAVFSVVAAGAEPIGYRWYQDGTPVGTGETLVLPSPGNADEGTYWVVVSNAFNTVTSQVAVLDLVAGTVSPVWQRAYSGADTEISVSTLPDVTGYSYAWKHDGVPVSGAAGSTLILGCVEPADAGSYSVVVSLGGNSVESYAATLVVLPPPSDYQTAVLADGPIAYWRLGETSGSTAGDEVAAHAGTYGSGAQLGQAGALAYDSDTAVNFTGATTSLVEVADGSTLSPAAFSVEFWAMVTGGAGTREAVSNMDIFLNQEAGGWAFRPIDGGSWQFRVVSSFDTVSTVTAPAAEGKWHHVVGTCDGTVMTLYLDGYQVGSHTNGYVVQTAASVPLRIGAGGTTADSANPAFFFVGTVDEVAIYDSMLSLDRIRAHFANGLAPTYLCMEPIGGGMQLSWPLGVLQTNDNVRINGNWGDVPGATSPYTPVLDQQQNNYRISVPVP